MTPEQLKKIEDEAKRRGFTTNSDGNLQKGNVVLKPSDTRGSVISNQGDSWNTAKGFRDSSR